MSWLNLDNKVVIVTGGASGIGKAIAQEFLNNGAYVIVGDLSDHCPDFVEAAGTLIYRQVNVTSRESVAAMVEDVMGHYQRIDVIVNNAGINIPRLLVDDEHEDSPYQLTDDIFDKIIGVNLKGVFLCSQIVAKVMVRQQSGVIINISSESGLEGSEGQSIYAATKNAVNSLTRSWAKELGKNGIRVVGVAPGILEETGLRTLDYEEALAYTRKTTIAKLRQGYSSNKTTPLGRVGRLQEVADLVNYLASDRAGYIHGVTYNVAGGKTRG